MSDLICMIGASYGTLGQTCLTPMSKPAPMVSAFGGVYRCKACSEAYIAAGGPIYSEAQLATFARIETEYQARVVRGEVPAGFRRT